MKAKGKRILSMILVVVFCMSSILSNEFLVNAKEEIEIEHTIDGEQIEGVTEADLKEESLDTENQTALFLVLDKGRNLTDQINHTSRIWLNGKEYQGGDIVVSKGDNFSYSYMWTPNLLPGESIHEGDYFEYTLFKVPNLQVVEHIKKPLVIRGINVGSWSIQYDRNSGEMKYRVDFNRYIQLFDVTTIQAELKGSGVFSNVTGGKSEVTLGEYKGSIEITESPSVPSRPSVAVGEGWKPELPPNYTNRPYPVGKGHRWNNQNESGQVPQIEWRIGFLEQLQKKQQEFIHTQKLEPLEGNCIIEETLDENIRFYSDPKENNSERFRGAPFHLELPVMVAGTDKIINGVVGNNNYDGFGRVAPYILGKDLKKIDGSKAGTEAEIKKVQDQVRSTPCSWTITTNPVTQRETLLINLGVLGGNDPTKGITWDQLATGESRWPAEGIQSQITNCEKKIAALDNGSDSPMRLLDGRHQAVVNMLINALNLSLNADQKTELSTELQKWRDSYETWRDNKAVGPLFQLEDEEGKLYVPLPDVSILEKSLTNVKVNKNGTLLKDTKEYKDFQLSFQKLRADQKTYLENRLKYREQWVTEKTRFEQTKEFYATKPIYGFTLNCRVQSVNTSAKKYENHVKISLEDRTWTAEDTVDVNFSNSVSGSFALGSLVIQKADHIYDVKNSQVDEQNLQKDNIAQVDRDRAGISGARFRVYCADSMTGELIQDEQHAVRFLDKDASPNGDTYVHRPDAGDIVEVTTDEEGKLILGGLSPLHAHYLVETGSPKGYYTDQTPIKLTTKRDQVVYHLVPNISRAVKLVKVDSYSKNPVEGAEFALFRIDDSNKEQRIEGFRKKSMKGKVFYIPDSSGRERLSTNAIGELCIHNLEPGNYRLKEIQAAPGYYNSDASEVYDFMIKEKLDSEHTGMDGEYHVLINQGKAVENAPMTANVSLHKIDGRTKEILPNAGFAIFRFKGTEEQWKRNPNEKTMWEAVSLNQKDGYFHTTQKWEEVRITNLPGDNAKVQALLTNQKGMLEVQNIPLGHYSIAEVKAPDRYHRDQSNYYFHVTPDNVEQSVKIYKGLGTEQKEVIGNEFHNFERWIQLKIVKGDARNMPIVTGEPAPGGVKYEGAMIQGKGLEGAVYKLFMRSGSGGIHPNPEQVKSTQIIEDPTNLYDPCIAVGATDEDGILDLKDMRDGKGQALPGLCSEKYYMIEVKAPEGYVLDQDPIFITLDERVFPTDAQGKIRPDGTPGLVLQAENKAYDYGIRILKQDATDKKPLKMVGFTLSENGQPVKVRGEKGRYIVDSSAGRSTMYTNEFGLLYVTGLKPGTVYTLSETQIPNGYQKMQPMEVTTPSGMMQEGVVQSNGILYKDYCVENERILGRVQIHKQDEETMNALSGAKFQLYRVDSDTKEEHPIGQPGVTDEHGNLTFDQLEWGLYYLKEIEAPKGYALSSQKLIFTIDRFSAMEEGYLTVKFPYVRNSKLVGEAILKKVDADHPDQRLPGAVFTLWKKTGEVQGVEQWASYAGGTYTTNENGEIRFLLPPGEYKVVEKKAPDGYMLPPKEYLETKFSIEETPDGTQPKSIEILIKNQKEPIPTGIYETTHISILLLGMGVLGGAVVSSLIFKRKKGK